MQQQPQQQQSGESSSSSDIIWVRIPVSELEPLGSNASSDNEEEGKEKAKAEKQAQSHPRSGHLAPPPLTTEGPESKKASWVRRLSDSLTGKKYSENPDHKETVRIVRMTREEYDMYWARDEATGRYIGTMPEGSGREWYRRKVEGWKTNWRNEGYWDKGMMNMGWG